MINIWISQDNEQQYHLFQELKQNDNHRILSSGNHTESFLRYIADGYLDEPEVNGDDYVNWCLEICSKFQIDVFFPGKEQQKIAERIQEFDAVGVTTAVERNLNLRNMMNSRFEVCQFVTQNHLCYSYDIHKAVNAGELSIQYHYMKTKYGKESYISVLPDAYQSHFSGWKQIHDKYTNDGDIELSQMIEKMKHSDDYPVVILPYITDSFVTIDCVPIGSQVLYIPQIQVNPKEAVVSFHPTLKLIAEKTGAVLQATNPYHICLGFWNQKYVITGIHSGFSQYSYRASATGCSLADLYIQSLSNQDIDVHELQLSLRSKKLGLIENYVILS